ncbi:hypothetical protein SSX86_027714 [Deinandra increscens subsp. villosa]|uniref:Uncharacterized protein n=1 Tax=Deinandra increscens subsp. villosa TaxID=3103831 RepID=A0AAP0GIN7_9ASTR
MAVDVCSSYEPFISPRISFSHDLNNQSSAKTETVTSAIADIHTTFDFCIAPNLKLTPVTSADELFYNGVLLPTQIKKHEAGIVDNEVVDVHRKRLKELLSENEDEHEKSSSRPFWRFTRTTSLNSGNGNGTGPKRLLRSLSLKRLLHSNSTSNPRGDEDTKVMKKSNSRKEPLVSSSCFSSVSVSVYTPPEPLGCKGNDSGRRTLTKKDSGGGIQINPVLNIPSAYNRNLFGYGSLFCKGKTINKTK